MVGWCLCLGSGFSFFCSFRLPFPRLWAGLVFLSFARGVGLAFFGWLFVGPECAVWFVVDGVVVGAFPSFFGG